MLKYCFYNKQLMESVHEYNDLDHALSFHLAGDEGEEVEHRHM